MKLKRNLFSAPLCFVINMECIGRNTRRDTGQRRQH